MEMLQQKKKFVKSYRSCNDVGAAIANRILSILPSTRPNRILNKFAYLNSSTTDDKWSIINGKINY